MPAAFWITVVVIFIGAGIYFYVTRHDKDFGD